MAIVAAVALVGAGVVALGLAGNDGEDGDGAPVSSGGGRDREPDPARDLTVDDIEPALLTLDDLPSDYAEADGDEGGEEEPLAVDDTETDPACREALEQLEGDGSEEGDDDLLVAEFERPDDDASVSHDLRITDSGTPTIGELADLLRQCESLSYEEDEMGTQVEMRMSVEEVEGLGDEAVAVEIELEISTAFTLVLRSHGLVWSRDGVQSNLVALGPLDPVTMEGGEPDRELARSAAEAVDARISEITGG